MLTCYLRSDSMKTSDFVNKKDGDEKTHVKELEKRVCELFKLAFPGIPIVTQLEWNSSVVLDDGLHKKKGYPTTDTVINFANNYPVYQIQKGPNTPGILDVKEATMFVEPTLQKKGLSKYIAQKIALTNKVISGKGGKNDVIKRAVSIDQHNLMQGSDPDSLNLLLIITPNSTSSDLEELSGIYSQLQDLENNDHPELKGFNLSPISKASGYEFINSNGDVLLVGQLSIEDITEFAYMVEEYQKRKKKGGPTTGLIRSFSDRLMWMLTNSKFGEYALLYDSNRPKSHNITIFEEDAKAGQKSIHAKGDSVTISSISNIKRHLIKMKIGDAAYLTTIPRSISDISSLQRLPQAKKMKMIAEENIFADEPFPTPIVVVAEKSDLFLRANVPNMIHGDLDGNDSTNPTPYSLQLVDGQHRVLSYYFTTGSNPDFLVDVVWYELPDNLTPQDKATIMSKIFFDINFRSTKPDDTLYYTHCAFMTHDWTDGWDKKWSPRSHATRFLLALNREDYLKDYFQFQGIPGTGEGIKSVVTYLQDAFDFKWMNKKGKSQKNEKAICWLRYMHVNKSGDYVGLGKPTAVFPNLQTKYHGLPGNTTYGPTPEELVTTGFWDLLVKEFTDFLDCLSLGSDKFEKFQTYCSENSSILAAIWKVFYKIVDKHNSDLIKNSSKLNFNAQAIEKIGVVLKNLELKSHSMVVEKGGAIIPSCGFNSVSGGGGVELFCDTFIDAYNKEKTVTLKL